MIETVQDSLIYVGMIIGLVTSISCLISAQDLRANVSSLLIPIPPTKRRIKIALYTMGSLVGLASALLYALLAFGVIGSDMISPFLRPIHIAALGVIGGLAIINSS